MKVGLGISPVTPSAWASPRTHSDFPAPSGPWSRRIVPGGRRGRWRAAWARVAAASAQISSGENLAEVVIAAEGKAAGVVALLWREAGADGSEWSGEGPLAQEGRDAFFGNGKEELIVFAAGEGESGCGTGGEGNLIGVDGEPDAGGAGEAGEVGSQSITEIEHGGGEFVADEPLALGKARGKGEVVMRPGAAEFSGHKKDVARFST